LTNPSAVYYRAPVPAIVVRDGPRAGERIELGDGETFLGRATSDFLGHDDEVSRRHAALRSTSAGVEVEDLGSANGTFVNDLRIHAPTRLSSGDTVRVGRTTLEVELEAAEQATVIREVTPPPVATPAPNTLPQPPVEAPTGPPASTPPPAAAHSPPSAPPAVQPYPGAPPAGASGVGLTVALIAFLAALLSLICVIDALRRVIQSPAEGADLVIDLVLIAGLVVAVGLDVPGGIALIRGRISGRVLVVLAGAVGFLSPGIWFGYAITRPGSVGTLTFLGWLLVFSMAVHITVMIMALAAGSRLTRRY
jgi:pSer/pThr/pTyr-binding forkhead associated (FHA) protein